MLSPRVPAEEDPSLLQPILQPQVLEQVLRSSHQVVLLKDGRPLVAFVQDVLPAAVALAISTPNPVLPASSLIVDCSRTMTRGLGRTSEY